MSLASKCIWSSSFPIAINAVPSKCTLWKTFGFDYFFFLLFDLSQIQMNELKVLFCSVKWWRISKTLCVPIHNRTKLLSRLHCFTHCSFTFKTEYRETKWDVSIPATFSSRNSFNDCRTPYTDHCLVPMNEYAHEWTIKFDDKSGEGSQSSARLISTVARTIDGAVRSCCAVLR